ncbi:MAG: metallophosphoesterase [Promethearchaeota archaeon]
MFLVGAVGDIHGPKYLYLFKNGLSSLKGNVLDDINCLFFAGDIISKGHTEDLQAVIRTIDDFEVRCPLISCFGNEEYEETHNIIREKFGSRVTFLDDESFVLNLKDDRTLGIVGSKGSLDRPTWWQSRNIPNILQIYSQRISVIGGLLQKLKTDFKILLLHYAPTFKTLGGEGRTFYQQLGSKKLETIISRSKPDVVIHAHAHNGRRFALLGEIPIYNVSLPLTRTITVIKLPGFAISDSSEDNKEEYTS